MAGRKEDQRIRMTKQLLQGALVALLAEKPLRAITVRELCQKAEVNRSTFYLHYCDIYALMEEIEVQITSELSDALDKSIFSRDQSVFTAMYNGIFELFARHAELCTILLGENGDKAFVSTLFALGREKCVSAWMQLYPNATRAEVALFYVFVSSGCVGILQYWFDSGCLEKPEEIARRVERLVERSITTLE